MPLSHPHPLNTLLLLQGTISHPAPQSIKIMQCFPIIQIKIQLFSIALKNL